ncbi:FAD-binding 8 [Penicillium angulare]|uniref:FAD-binding 8 n=1 Tax=Penicillium angulare TaxID=116970 RepID=UPI002541B2B9|nr:FAD-binding 8 [Penicillium angulare]KAJ5272462.1 FAD-binding 8 [Penicillium angulare]
MTMRQDTSFGRQEFVGYLWTSAGLWIFDRLLRVVRMVYCNMNAHVGGGFLRATSSTATYDPVSDLIKIEIVPGVTTSPNLGGILKFLENHTFSLGAWASASEVKAENGSPKDNLKKLIFYIRPYDGWTRRLPDQCRKASGVFHPKLLLKGPYGHTEPMHHFHRNLIVVGGTGIACIVVK